jgi:4-diphosphocytidyl-2-C-methyl-D-erythritol kinase
MRVRAFAKINLSLRVLGARADGYHELRTIFQSIALHDTLTIRAARGPFRLTCDDPNCPTDETNLIWRAAERMWKAAGRRGAVRDIAVDLEKRIPVQGGLGGGSSDGAAALRALGRRWGIDERKVRAAASQLGADVPYFFEGGTALGVERGDLLFPLIDWPAAWVVLVIPGFGVSTKDAFEWWDEGRSSFDPSTLSGSSRAESRDDKLRMREGHVRTVTTDSLVLSLPKDELVNDLEPPVSDRYPRVARAVDALNKAGASHAAMSGSGSAVFGLFPRRADAVRAAGAVASRACRSIVTRTVNRSTYQALAAK